jgi:hypothetical protein
MHIAVGIGISIQNSEENLPRSRGARGRSGAGAQPVHGLVNAVCGQKPLQPTDDAVPRSRTRKFHGLGTAVPR